MATLKIKKLDAALAKAKRVGRAELAIAIDGCNLVLQSLAPDDYDSIIEDTQDLDGAEYVHAYQTAHVCRSIVEIDGVDLRDYKFVEDEAPAGAYILNVAIKSPSKAKDAKEVLAKMGLNATIVEPNSEDGTKVINLERHEWVRQQMGSWGREAIFVAMQKFAEVVLAAETKARDGVTFNVAEESYADRYRRLMSEAKALEAEIPPDMLNNILTEYGYLQKSSQEELETAAEQLQRLTPDPEEEEEPEPESEPAPIARDDDEMPVVRTKKSEAPTPTMNNDQLKASLDLMKRRQPMNREAIAPPIVAQPSVQSASVPAKVPPQLANAMAASKTRSSTIADLESQLDPNLMGEVEAFAAAPKVEKRELVKPMVALEGREILNSLDPRPVGGINPRFKKPG